MSEHGSGAVQPRAPASPGRSSIRPVVVAALLFAWLGYTTVLGVLYVHKPPCPDNSAFDYIAWVANEGGLLYVDAADQNWPGQMLIQRVSVALFGNHLWSYRLFDFLVLLAGACGVLFWFTRYFLGMAAAVVVVPVYQGLYVSAGYWASGQRDFVAAPLLLIAAMCFVRRARGGSRRWLVASGLAIGSATLIRPTLLCALPLFALLDLITSRSRGRVRSASFVDHLLAAVFAAVPILVIGLVGAASGWLSAWYEVSVQFTVEVYSHTSSPGDLVAALFSWERVRGYYWVGPVSLVGAVYYWRHSRLALLAAGILWPTYIVSYLAQGKGLRYHLTGLFVLDALLIAAAVAWALGCVCSPARPRVARAFALLLVVAVGVGLAKKVHRGLHRELDWLLGRQTTSELHARYQVGEGVSVADAVELAEHVAATTRSTDEVLFWGRPSLVNFLGKRRSPLRPAGHSLLVRPGPTFSLFDKWREEIERAFVYDPPTLILLIREEDGGYRNVPDLPGDHGVLADVLRANLARYELERTVGSVDVLRLRR